MTIGFATASLLARDISGSDTQSGFVQTSQVLGAAVASYLLARLMSRRGRRAGLVTGYLIGAAGSMLAVAGGVAESMTLLLVGAALLGATSAANNSSRYAATDLAAEHSRARALSIVVWASTIGAVAGPNLTGLRRLDRPAAVVARAHRTVRRRDRRHPGRGPRAVRRAAAGPAAGSPGRRPTSRSSSHTSWRRRFTVVRERPLLQRGDGRDGRRPRRDDHGDGDDAAPHGSRRRRAGDHRRGDQRARARHVRLRPRGRHRGRPGRAGPRRRWPAPRSCSSP